ncbi:MAG: MFS transporter [Rhodobacteraceae bacterium]|nr:MFS transporter [Paracoccaceae bacterium]MBR9821018.1 MFS transporter [Paracoccaceae bacterium]
MTRPDASAAGRRATGRWLVLAALWAVYFSFGAVATSLAPLLPLVAEEIGSDNARMGLILGAWPLVYLFAAVPAGLLLDVVGGRLALCLAGLLIGASGIGRALADTEAAMFLAVAVLGLGGPLVSIGAPKLIAALFSGARRGLALGINLTGPALGSSFSLALSHGVLLPMTGDWRLVLALYGGLGVASGLLWFLVAHPSRLPEREPPAGRGDEAPGADGLRAVLGQNAVRLVLLMAVAIFFLNHAMNNWLPEILRAGGLAPGPAGFLAAVPTLVGIAGALLIPGLASSARRLKVLMGLSLGALLGSLLLQGAALVTLVPALVLLGLCRGALVPVATLALLEARGVAARRHGMVIGLFFAAGELGGVLGPVTLGVLARRTGDFATGTATLALVAAGLVALTALLAREERGRRSAPEVEPLA